jgi:hypothetical protein
MPIDKTELEAKIQEFLGTLNDDKDSTYISDRGMAEELFPIFINWLFKADIEKEARRQQYLALKAEFEGIDEDAPKPAIAWERHRQGYLARLGGLVVGAVRPDNHGIGWTADRWNEAKIIDARHFDSREEAKTWAVGHI